jgi:hypothetical protein
MRGMLVCLFLYVFVWLVVVLVPHPNEDENTVLPVESEGEEVSEFLKEPLEEQLHQMTRIKHLARGGNEYISFGTRITTKKIDSFWPYVKLHEGVNFRATCECNEIKWPKCLEMKLPPGMTFDLCGYPAKQ